MKCLMPKLFHKTFELLIALSVMHVFAIYFTVLHLVGIPEEKWLWNISGQFEELLQIPLCSFWSLNMEQTKKHTYRQHLSPLYIWMCGGQREKQVLKAYHLERVNFSRTWELVAKNLENCLVRFCRKKNPTWSLDKIEPEIMQALHQF